MIANPNFLICLFTDNNRCPNKERIKISQFIFDSFSYSVPRHLSCLECCEIRNPRSHREGGKLTRQNLPNFSSPVFMFYYGTLCLLCFFPLNRFFHSKVSRFRWFGSAYETKKLNLISGFIYRKSAMLARKN